MELLHNAIEGVANARYDFRHALKRKSKSLGFHIFHGLLLCLCFHML